MQKGAAQVIWPDWFLFGVWKPVSPLAFLVDTASPNNPTSGHASVHRNIAQSDASFSLIVPCP